MRAAVDEADAQRRMRRDLPAIVANLKPGQWISRRQGGAIQIRSGAPLDGQDHARLTGERSVREPCAACETNSWVTYGETVEAKLTQRGRTGHAETVRLALCCACGLGEELSREPA